MSTVAVTTEAAAGDEDHLPGPGDPFWDELTGTAVGELRRLRSAHRRQRSIESAYNAYVAVLILGVYGGGLVAYAVRAGGRSGAPTPTALSTALPAGLTGLALLLLLSAATTGAWRGPVTLDGATVSWLLPLPIRWTAVLRPRWRLSLLVSGVVGLGAGAVLGLILAALRVCDPGPGVGGGLVAGLLLGVSSAGIGALVEAPARVSRLVTRWAWVVRLVVLGLAAQAVLAATGRTLTGLAGIEIWSGPWGWAVQPLLSATGGAAGSAAGWPIALAATAVLAVVLAVGGARAVPRIRGAALRTRAATWSDVSGGVGTFDFRLARTSIDAARGRQRRVRLRLPPPRSAGAAVLWRDALSLLRDPGRPVAGLLWLLAGLGLGELAAATVSRTGLGALAVSVPAVAAVYRAAAVLLEPARLESDDRRRSVQLPFQAGSLALRHAVLPVASLMILAVLATIGFGLAGQPVAPAVLLTLAVPACAGGALVGAYRGQVPVGLLVGIDSPLGNTGGVQVVFWYLRGALAAVVPLLAALAIPLLRGSGWNVAGAGILALGLALLSWGRSRATALAKP